MISSKKYLIYLAVLIIGFDFILGSLLEKLYFSDKSKKNDPQIYSILGTNEEMLIFGSSRAVHHYNPIIFERELKMTSYNVGSGGQNIYYHLAVLESTITRYKPKLVLFELMNIDFEETSEVWDTEKLGVLLPFYNKSVGAQRAVLRRGDSEKIKTLSKIYPFNSLIYEIIRNNYYPFNNSIKGYIPINKTWGVQIESEKGKDNIYDENKISALHNFIELCQTNEIQLVICISPIFKRVNGFDKYEKIVNELMNNYNIKVLDHLQDTSFINHNFYFSDPVHLNSKGAEYYSYVLTSQIKDVLSDSLTK